MSSPKTLSSLRDALESGQTSSETLTRAALNAAIDPAGEGARTFTFIDVDGALAQARATDTLRHAGVRLSPLMGIPVSVKDLFDVAGQVTRAGSRVLDDAPPAAHDAVIVARLRAAGAVIVGRTNMVEFAYSGLGINPHYGTPRNPWDRAIGRIPGGSSSGAAVSVSDGMCAAAIGTDTGGSVRIPAAFCGITGFKPTAARVDRSGTLPLSTSLDSIGPLAASVECCAILDAILAGQSEQRLAPRNIADLRFALPASSVMDGLDDAVAVAFSEAISTLSRAGASIVEMPFAELGELAGLHALGGLSAPESYAWHRKLLERRGDGYDPRVGQRIQLGAKVSAADYIDLLAARRDWITRMNRRVQGFDALLMPTVAVLPQPIASLVDGDDAHYRASNALVLRNTSAVNFWDGCALSLPLKAPGGAPVGLMVAGPGGSEHALLAVGAAVEQALADA